MTRLFIRFYLGVIAILFGAWLIQGYVLEQSSASQNIRVVERALSGGARLARERLSDAAPGQHEIALKEIQAVFEYPVHALRVPDHDFTPEMRSRLKNGEVVYGGGFVSIGLPESAWALTFGPLPEFVGPSQAVVTLGFGALLTMIAAAIAVLLRPVASQLRAVEKTATAIAAGDLSARIDSAQVPKGLPLANAFNKMADQTETLLRSQRELLQLVSHELRTPLARIRFATDLIETSKTDEERRARLDAVDNATQELDELVGELLRYVRLESDAPATQLERIEVNTLLSELVATHAPLHAGVEFRCDQSDGDINVLADHAGLSRSIGNLLSNAGRFAKRHVNVRAIAGKDQIEIQVDDDGDGIADSDREKIFAPFVRLDNATDRGSGLGLALVKRIAIGMGGTVAVSESPEGGSRFTVALPVAGASSSETDKGSLQH